MFIALSDMKITSRIDAYFTNLKLPWEKPTATHVTVGALVAYKVSKEAETGTWKFDRVWVKSYPVQTNILCWDNSLNMLAVGMDDGNIYYLKIAPEYRYMQYEDVGSIKAHTARVMGLAIEGSKGIIFSVGEDKKAKISNLKNGETVAGNVFLANLIKISL